MAKTVRKAPETLKLLPYERVVTFTSKQMFDDLSKRKALILELRSIIDARDAKYREVLALDEDARKLGEGKLAKLQEKVAGYVTAKFKPLLAATEDTREVILSESGEVQLVIYDKVKELAAQLEKQRDDESNEAKAKKD